MSSGYDVCPVYIKIYEQKMPLFTHREIEAVKSLAHMIHQIGLPGKLHELQVLSGDFLWHFQSMMNDGEIPRRNKRIMDYLIERVCIPMSIANLGMGEYVGADTWLVRDHVGAQDADARYLEAYLLAEYGDEFRLITLRDFGESRYKSDRVKILADGIGKINAHWTSNCLMDSKSHCGLCYKCVERSAAFMVAGIEDRTYYQVPPTDHKFHQAYVQQMNGRDQPIPFDRFKEASQ